MKIKVKRLNELAMLPTKAHATDAGFDLYAIGERFAQLVIMPIPAVEFELAEELSESERGVGGYGSSGK